MAVPRLEPNRRRSLSDPLTAALRPPPNETPEERESRIRAEEEAKRVSDGIDEQLRAERKARKARPLVKVLLLGQSESGKSTTLKQFQLLHTSAAFRAERTAWRAVIYLNLVRSIRIILDAIAPESDVLDDQDVEDDVQIAPVIMSPNGPHSSGTRVVKYESYRKLLSPLTHLENRLTRMLSAPDEDEATHLAPAQPQWNSYSQTPTTSRTSSSVKSGRPHPSISIPSPQASYPSPVSPLSSSTSGGSLPSPGGAASSSLKGKNKEVSVYHTNNWRRAFALGSKTKSPKSAYTNEIEGWWDDPDDPVHILNACSPAMLELWRDPSVKQRLRERRIRIEETSGFYLDEIMRITALRYIPTDDDILKARLKTLGVVEHTFKIQSGNVTQHSVDWRIYDVGGAQNQRPAWAPYFEDVNAIIFLAPISAFDQVLDENPRMNRLADSLSLWQSVVSNKLLANVSIVLFLNKIDLLKGKLQSGVRLAQYIPTYGDKPNDYDSVSKFIRNRFSMIHQTHTPNKERELHIHFTSVTDTRRTQKIIASVQEFILQANLKEMDLW